MRKYSKLANMPSRTIDERYYGKARGYNVLYFIMETVPAGIVALDQDLGDLPTFKMLRNRSFLATRHYAVSLRTNRDWYSLLTSKYAIDGQGFVSLFEKPVKSLVNPLADEGYSAKIYYTDLYNNSQIFKSLGFADQSPQNYTDADILDKDMEKLSLFLGDIKKWSRDNRRFVAMVGPQVGHPPWKAGWQGEENPDEDRLIRRTTVIQDSMLRRIVETLREAGQLEKTLIVVMADHGVRTRDDYKPLKEGIMSSDSFHVPMMIYAPGVISETVTIPWVTSHIDVKPTLLDLLGVEEGRETEMGTALWNDKLSLRATYCFSRLVNGCDGYHQNGRFNIHKYSVFDDIVYSNVKMDFAPENAVPINDPLHGGVVRNMAAMNRIVEALNP